jgi:Mg/Co/Ni transporter MgtE
MRNRGMGAGTSEDMCVQLEQEVLQLKKALAESTQRNARLVNLLSKQYGGVPRGGEDDGSGLLDPEDGSVTNSVVNLTEPSFLASLWDRGSWLASLLLFQSFSSFILSHHEEILRKHPTVVFYLTALVGAGGNAGNQAAVRIIRAIALGLVTEKNQNSFLQREAAIGLALSFLLGFVVVLRTFLSSCSFMETISILVSIMLIVCISVNLGALIPLLLQKIKLDPAHASTTIQVIMDISGVLITCRTAQFLMGSE